MLLLLVLRSTTPKNHGGSVKSWVATVTAKSKLTQSAETALNGSPLLDHPCVVQLVLVPSAALASLEKNIVLGDEVSVPSSSVHWTAAVGTMLVFSSRGCGAPYTTNNKSNGIGVADNATNVGVDRRAGQGCCNSNATTHSS
jgi:hypothetical protein